MVVCLEHRDGSQRHLHLVVRGHQLSWSGIQFWGERDGRQSAAVTPRCSSPPPGPRWAATSSSTPRPKGPHRSPGSRSRPPRAARSRPSGRPRRPSTVGSPSGPRVSSQTTTLPAYASGTWSIQSVATEVGGTTATSSPVQITLVTLADLVSSSTFSLSLTERLRRPLGAWTSSPAPTPAARASVPSLSPSTAARACSPLRQMSVR